MYPNNAAITNVQNIIICAVILYLKKTFHSYTRNRPIQSGYSRDFADPAGFKTLSVSILQAS